MTIAIRPATPEDEPLIRAMARNERVKPIGLDWPNFIVATEGAAIVGAVQMRKHADGSRELGTLMVRSDRRGRAIAARMIDTLLAPETKPVFMITGRDYAAHYDRWGFRTKEPSEVPALIRRNFRIGCIGGSLVSLLKGRKPRRLAIYERAAA